MRTALPAEPPAETEPWSRQQTEEPKRRGGEMREASEQPAESSPRRRQGEQPNAHYRAPPCARGVRAPHPEHRGAQVRREASAALSWHPKDAARREPEEPQDEARKWGAWLRSKRREPGEPERREPEEQPGAREHRDEAQRPQERRHSGARQGVAQAHSGVERKEEPAPRGAAQKEEREHREEVRARNLAEEAYS